MIPNEEFKDTPLKACFARDMLLIFNSENGMLHHVVDMSGHIYTRLKNRSLSEYKVKTFAKNIARAYKLSDLN